MPPKKFATTQLRVTDMHESDDTLQAAALTAERTTPTVLLEAEIDDDDDGDLYEYLAGQRCKDSLIDNDIGDLYSHITDEDHVDVATQNWLMPEMLHENQSQWNAKKRVEWEKIAAERERMAAKRDQWAAKHAERTEQSTMGPRPNIYMMGDPIRSCGGAKALVLFLDVLHSCCNCHGHLLQRGGPNRIEYAISLLEMWSNHPNPTLRQMAMTDPSEWVGD
jgi:hypothetical protein